MSIRWLPITLTCLVCLMFASPSSGDEEPRPRVVLVTNHVDARIVPVLKAELELLGLEVVQVDKGQDDVVPENLTQAARKTSAVAGFRVIVAKKSVEVWIADRVTGKVVLRRVLKQRERSRTEESTVVLQAIELLRVSLMELEAPHEPHGEVKPPKGLDKLVGFPESKALHAMTLGVGAMYLSSDVPMLAVARLGGSTRIAGPLRLDLWGLTGVTTPEVEGPEGVAEVEPHLAVAALTFAPAEPTDRWQPSASMGGGLSWTSIKGDADTDYADFEHRSLSPAVSAEARLAYRVSNVRPFAGIGAAWLSRRPAVSFDERRVATFSRVLLHTIVGVEVAWP